MKIFIIGGAGYIGSHMVKIAHMAGHDVITVDNLSTGHQDAVLYGEFELCDILDATKLDKLFKKHKPDAVMHFSAYSLVGIIPAVIWYDDQTMLIIWAFVFMAIYTIIYRRIVHFRFKFKK